VHDERQEAPLDDWFRTVSALPHDGMTQTFRAPREVGTAVRQSGRGFACAGPLRRVAARCAAPAAMRYAAPHAPRLREDYGRRPHRCLQPGK